MRQIAPLVSAYWGRQVSCADRRTGEEWEISALHPATSPEAAEVHRAGRRGNPAWTTSTGSQNVEVPCGFTFIGDTAIPKKEAVAIKFAMSPSMEPVVVPSEEEVYR